MFSCSHYCAKMIIVFLHSQSTPAKSIGLFYSFELMMSHWWSVHALQTILQNKMQVVQDWVHQFLFVIAHVNINIPFWVLLSRLTNKVTLTLKQPLSYFSSLMSLLYHICTITHFRHTMHMGISLHSLFRNYTHLLMMSFLLSMNIMFIGSLVISSIVKSSIFQPIVIKTMSSFPSHSNQAATNRQGLYYQTIYARHKALGRDNLCKYNLCHSISASSRN